MTPAFYVAYGVILTLLATSLIFFGACAYYLAIALKEAGVQIGELALSLHGLPNNLYGVSPALAKLADGVVAHEVQMGALVAVIADANKNAPVEKPPEFDPNGRDTNFDAHIPQSPFEEEPS